MAAPILEVLDLSVSYHGDSGARRAISNVNFSLAPGATLGVIGESGSGKTTLALALAGLIDPATTWISGAILFEGQNLLLLDEEELSQVRGAGIGMVFQDAPASLDPSQTVVGQVAESLKMHEGLDRKEALESATQKLVEVGISQEVQAVAPYAHQLSGGQCQRAMIAAALAGSPRLLIADEPTSSLDTTIQSQIIQLLKKRQRARGLAMIFISHDLALVSNVAEEILVMFKGKAVEQGSREEILGRPRHAYTAELVAAWHEGVAWEGDPLGAA